MSNKETVIKKILKLVAKLHNECKVPSVFGVNSTNGVISYGSKEVVSKFQSFLADDDSGLLQAFDVDQTAIFNGDILDENCDIYNVAQSNIGLPKLPANLDLMVYNEIHPIVTKEILKWHWRHGGKMKVVHYGHPDFCADFWPSSWPWANITKCFSNLKKNDYTGPNNLSMTEFFRTVLRNILDMYEIDPETHVSKSFTIEQRRKREKYKGIRRPVIIQADVEASPIEDEISAVLDSEEFDHIEAEIGTLPRMSSLLPGLFPNESESGSVMSTYRPPSVPIDKVVSMHTVKRKTPAELNNRSIPSNQPRLHVSFSDDQNSLNISDVSGSISRLRSRTISILNGQQIKPIRFSQ